LELLVIRYKRRTANDCCTNQGKQFVRYGWKRTATEELGKIDAAVGNRTQQCPGVAGPVVHLFLGIQLWWCFATSHHHITHCLYQGPLCDGIAKKLSPPGWCGGLLDDGRIGKGKFTKSCGWTRNGTRRDPKEEIAIMVYTTSSKD